MILVGEYPQTLAELLEIVREFVKERDWDQYNLPLNLAVSTSIEVGELLELFQWKTNEDVAEALKDEEFRDNPWSTKLFSRDYPAGFFQDYLYNFNQPETFEFACQLRQLADSYPSP